MVGLHLHLDFSFWVCSAGGVSWVLLPAYCTGGLVRACSPALHCLLDACHTCIPGVMRVFCSCVFWVGLFCLGLWVHCLPAFLRSCRFTMGAPIRSVSSMRSTTTISSLPSCMRFIPGTCYRSGDIPPATCHRFLGACSTCRYLPAILYCSGCHRPLTYYMPVLLDFCFVLFHYTWA